MTTVTTPSATDIATANLARAADVAAAQTEGVEDEAALNSDFETFLTMLSVQMQNQDPLNPQDSTEFATQLAQFSTVEQQTLTNTLLTNLGAQLGAMGLSNLSTWVGMEARVTGPANFSGTPIDVAPNANPLANSAYLVVRNASGNEVQRYAISPNDSTVEWTGVDSTGSSFAEGNYTFETESYSANGELMDTVYADVYLRVNEARSTDEGVLLMAKGGLEFSSDNVISLRQPS